MFRHDRRRPAPAPNRTEPRLTLHSSHTRRGPAALIAVARRGTVALAVALVAAPATAPAATAATPGHGATAETSAVGAAPFLEPLSIDAAFRSYMDGLMFHDMSTFRAATCPRLRATLKGFELHGYYIEAWRTLPYEYDADSSSASVTAVVSQEDPVTGAWAGDVTYDWNVEQDADGSYYVCGWSG